MATGGTSISHEEFQRMQTQLLDLRTANYTLMEESNRYRNELRNTVAKYESIEKEFQKAQKTLEKSRKARDVEMLFAENESLQRKLLSQEEEFRLQNQTLLNELALLVASNEKLEASIKSRESEEFSARESLSQGNQCDLLTEYYEEQLQNERNKNRQLLEENSAKHETIEHQSATIDDLKQSHDNQMSVLREEIQSIQVEADRVPKLTSELDECHRNESELQVVILRLEEECSSKLSEAHCANQKLQKQHLEEIDLLRADWAEKEKQYEIQLELSAAQRTEFEEEAARARQEAQDAVEDVRIAERRVASVTQDLRRQLRAERRRADKLQERLRDLISDGSAVSGVRSESNTSVDPDNCSVSSWSLMSGQNESNSNGNAPPATPDHQRTRHESPGSNSASNEPDINGTAPVDLAAENGRLVGRLAQIQQDKWRLEERVSHLEESNAAMADEMVRRGQLIQFYCMDQRPNVIKAADSGSPLIGSGEKLSVRRMVSLIRHQISSNDSSILSGDSMESGSDVQKRLQLMLEETLTKNMHLTEDLERLSQEVVRLSQLVGASQMGKPLADTPIC